MGTSGKPGTGTKVVPDLATAAGEHDADFKTWTYHLKAGIKWQDGTPITSADIKYGIERLFATDGHQRWPASTTLCLLDNCDKDGTATYKGPYKDKTGGLTTIETPDDYDGGLPPEHVDPDVRLLMSLATSAPVKKSADTGK